VRVTLTKRLGQKLQWGPVVVTGISRAHRATRHEPPASMGSGRGDRNQVVVDYLQLLEAAELQWGPVVVTGISPRAGLGQLLVHLPASMGSGRGDRNQPAISSATRSWTVLQWGPVVVTGIRMRKIFW